MQSSGSLQAQVIQHNIFVKLFNSYLLLLLSQFEFLGLQQISSALSQQLKVYKHQFFLKMPQ